MKPLRRTLPAEASVISSSARTARYIASDQTLDSYREIVRAAGWVFDRFAKNAPFVDSHNYDSVGYLLGHVTAWKVEGDKLVEDVQFVPAGLSPLADFAWQLTETGFLRAVSVGFMPRNVRSAYRDKADFAAACAELKLSAEQSALCECIHWTQEQTELSAVLIGANPSAVALAHKSGAVSDEDFARIGFDDDALQFLHDATQAFTPDALKNAQLAATRRSIRAELRRITGVQFSSNNGATAPGTKKGAPPVPGQRDGAHRAALLESLRTIGASASAAR